MGDILFGSCDRCGGDLNMGHMCPSLDKTTCEAEFKPVSVTWAKKEVERKDTIRRFRLTFSENILDYYGESKNKPILFYDMAISESVTRYAVCKPSAMAEKWTREFEKAVLKYLDGLVPKDKR